MAIRYGRYETIDTIASGGMATVYLGRAVGEGGFERLVAIKVMHPHIAADPDFQAMFLDEARLAARIRHPNVVGVIDVQKAPEGMFLVMDYVDGRGLNELRRLFRKMRSTLPIAITLRLFVDALTGLHAAHELTGSDGQPLHLVHRDVSPHNILVGKDGVTRITDFGVARAEARLGTTRGAQLKGKIAYMAPEHVKNERLDRRADVYSAGCALWEVLVGKRLFRADSDAGLIHLILAGPEHSPSSIDDTIPEAVDRVCMKALSGDPNDRQSSAGEFADELEVAARISGIEIATHRQVASFIKGLPPAKVDPQPASPSSPSATTLRSDPAQATGSGASGVVVTGASLPGNSATNTAAVLSMMPPPSRRPLWLALAAAAIGAVVVVAYLASSGLASSGLASSGPSEVPAAAPSVEASTPDTTTEPAVEPSATASAAPAASSSAPKVAPPPATQVPKAAPPRPQPNPGQPSGPGYNPTEL